MRWVAELSTDYTFTRTRHNAGCAQSNVRVLSQMQTTADKFKCVWDLSLLTRICPWLWGSPKRATLWMAHIDSIEARRLITELRSKLWSLRRCYNTIGVRRLQIFKTLSVKIYLFTFVICLLLSKSFCKWQQGVGWLSLTGPKLLLRYSPHCSFWVLELLTKHIELPWKI